MSIESVDDLDIAQFPDAHFIVRTGSRENWLKEREQGIGSSDAAAVLGLSRFKSPLALYYDKLGVREDSPRAVEAAEWGKVLEDPIARRYAAVTGRAIASLPEHCVIHSKKYPFALAVPDRLIVGHTRAVESVPIQTGMGLLEVKNVDFFMGKQWDEDNNNEPPLEVQIQLQHQLMVTGLTWGSIAALVGGNWFVWADRPRDEQIIDLLAHKEAEFWAHVLEKVPPPADGSESSREILKRLYPRDSGETISLDMDAVEMHALLEDGKKRRKAAQADIDIAQNRLQQMMGDASYGVLPNGEGTYSFKSQERASYTVAATSFRVLRHSKPKEKK